MGQSPPWKRTRSARCGPSPKIWGRKRARGDRKRVREAQRGRSISGRWTLGRQRAGRAAPAQGIHCRTLQRRSGPERRRRCRSGARIMLLTRNMTESRRRKMYLMEPETHLKNGRLFSSLCFFSRNLVNRKWIEQQDITAPNF